MRKNPAVQNIWRRATRALGVLALLFILSALAVGVSLAQGNAPTVADAPLGSSSIGDTVFNDFNVDGDEDGGETGIISVTVKLYKDDGDGVIEASDYLSTTTTNSAGYYDFAVDGDEKYWVVLDPANFAPGGALEDYIFTSGNTIGGALTSQGIAYEKDMPLNQLDFNDADFGLVKVGLRISLSPGAATNIVNDPHVFTATVQSKIGNGAWTNVSGATPSIAYSPVPGTPGSSPVNCGPTNASGICTVTINSTTPGVFSATGTVTTNVTVNIPDGVGGSTPTPISRTRVTGAANNTAAGGSGPATKTYVDLRISLNPLSATNAVNQSHTYTATVQQNTGTGGWTNVPNGTLVSFNVTSTLSGSNPQSCTTTNGQCSISVNSAVADVLNIQASSTVTVGGESITRTTGVAPNTTNGGTGSATKTYVNLRVRINPTTDTNAVNQSHTFTVTVEQQVGTGAWTPVTGASPTVSVSPTPSTPAGSCGATNASGQCTFSINSNVAGVFKAKATLTNFSVNGQPLTRSTNSDAVNTAAGGTGNATKTYVNLRISIDPQTDTNAVNQSHTFTVTVEQQVGNGAWTPVTGASPTVSVSPTPSTAPGSCGATNASGQCTFSINSNAAGVFTATATLTNFSVNGQPMTRSTNSDAVNTAAGGTESAAKTYVNLRISINPQVDTNAVNQSHTFTVTVEQQVGNGAWTPVSGASPTVSVSPTPSTPAGSCGATNASGQCSFSINSDVADVFTANATLTNFSVNGQLMTRSTNSDAVNTAAGGTGSATKTYVDMRIQIGPQTATNSVNDPHTFTITVTQNLGNGVWVAVADGTKPVVSISPTPNGGTTDNCSATGTTAGVCTVVINSSVVNVFSVNASLTNFLVSGQSISRSTNSSAGTAFTGNTAAGGTGTATKTYVAGLIGDKIWWDIDKDGNQDGGSEPGIPGVTIFLYSTPDGTGSPLATTTTDANGIYTFTGLGADTYSIRIDPLEFGSGGTVQNWLGSPANAGSVADTADSDANPITHLIQNIVIDPVAGGTAQNDTTQDIGFFQNSGHTVTKARVTDPTSTGVRVNEPISFTITVVNTGTTWLDTVPVSDTFNSLYIQFLSANISGVNASPNITVTDGVTITRQWNDITGAGQLAPGATIVLNVFFVGVGDTTLLPIQAPCVTAQFSCNVVSTTSPTGDGPTVDPDGPGPLPPQENVPPKESNAPVKVVNPTGIALANYSADITQTSVTVRWTTVNESEISGFDVYRIDSARASVHIGHVDAQKAGQSTGTTYSLTDNGAAYGASYTYVLEAHLFGGGKNVETLANTRWLWLANIVR